MLRKISIRRRIMLGLMAIYVVTIATTTLIGWAVLKADAIRVAQEKTDLFTGAMNANRRYMVEHLRPQVRKRLPNAGYFPEGSVGIFMLSTIARMITEEHPEYIYRIASPNPLNPNNLAKETEADIIQRFQNQGEKQWKGFVNRHGEQFYVVSTPMTSKAGCMRCHSTPEHAPPELVARYGQDSGYGYKPNQVVGGVFTYVPMSIALSEARNKLIYAIGVLSIFFLIVLLVVDQVLVHSVVKPIKRFMTTAEAVSTGDLSREFVVDTEDEMKPLADAFNRMKISIEKLLEKLNQKKMLQESQV